MIYEVFTVGGGEFLVDMFNGVAALMNSDSYSDVLAISGLLGLTWVLLQTSFGGSYKANAKWFMCYVMVYNMLFLPKVDVHITDPLNPALRSPLVANVPFGLAFFASTTSKIGHELTNLSEAAFSLPDDLSYQKNGMLFGNKLLRESVKFRVLDGNFNNSLKSFMHRCAFIDAMLPRGNITFEGLVRSDDIWGYLSDKMSPLRRFTYYNAEGFSRRPTCREGYKLLNDRMVAEVDKTIASYASRILPQVFKDSNVPPNQQLLQYLPVTYDYFIDSAKSSRDVVRQNMMINMYHSAMEHGLSLDSAALSSYQEARATQQAKLQYGVTAALAEKFVPLLRIVFEALYYGSFPFIFMLMLLPVGATVIRNYIIGLFSLQLWGPLFALLHRIQMGNTSSIVQGLVGKDGITVYNAVEVAGVANDAALIAGYLSMSIPVISYMLVRGLGNMSSLSGGVMSAPQSGANMAASELAAGNLSFGNINMDNMSRNVTNANKFDTNATHFSGEYMSNTERGGTSRITQSGDIITNTSGALSQIPQYTPEATSSRSQELSRMADQANSASKGYSASAANSRTAAYSDVIDYVTGSSYNSASNNRFNESLSVDERESMSKVKTLSESFAKSEGLSEGVAKEYIAGIGTGQLFPVISANLSAKGHVASHETYERAKNLVESNQLESSLAMSSSAMKNSEYSVTGSDGENLSKSIRSNLDEARSYEERSTESYNSYLSYSEQSRQTEAISNSRRTDLTQAMVNAFDYHKDEYDDLRGKSRDEVFSNAQLYLKSLDDLTYNHVLPQDGFKSKEEMDPEGVKEIVSHGLNFHPMTADVFRYHEEAKDHILEEAKKGNLGSFDNFNVMGRTSEGLKNAKNKMTNGQNEIEGNGNLKSQVNSKIEGDVGGTDLPDHRRAILSPEKVEELRKKGLME